MHECEWCIISKCGGKGKTYEVFILPRLPQTGNLKKENSVIVQKIVDLTQERAEAADTAVLCHLLSC